MATDVTDGLTTAITTETDDETLTGTVEGVGSILDEDGEVVVDTDADPVSTNTDLDSELASYLALQLASQATILAYNTESNMLNAAHSNKKSISDKIGNS